jgi:hypothetical protein
LALVGLVAALSGATASTSGATCFHPTLTLAPLTQLKLVGTSATVTAHFATPCGPVSGATVNFTGTGVNAPISGTGTTDANGNASFTYTGNNRGTDTLQAAVRLITSNSVTVNWGILERNGTFSCRATALNLLGIQPIVANAADNPCKAAKNSLLTLGTIASAVNAQTTLSEGTLPAAGDTATASASVATVNITQVPGHQIAVGAVQSQAAVSCEPALLGGLAPKFSSSSNVATITIDGATTTVGSGPLKLSIPNVATIWLNRTISGGGTRIQRAVEVDLGTTRVAVVAESKVDVAGSPCGTVLVP